MSEQILMCAVFLPVQAAVAAAAAAAAAAPVATQAPAVVRMAVVAGGSDFISSFLVRSLYLEFRCVLN